MKKVAVAVLVSLWVGCGTQDATTSTGEQPQPGDLSYDLSLGSRVHVLRPQNAAPVGGPANLQYYGGHVISNVKPIAVFWGNSVDPTVVSSMPGFFQAVVDNPYMDWLSEYDTNISSVSGQPGTNQHIGRGTFGGSYTITPSNTSTALQDSDIQSELAAQINSGALPANGPNNIYFVHFPPGVSITQGGQGSCQAFCAYHGTFQLNGQDVFYAVMPDFSPGSACTVCGSLPWFDNFTSAASHELIEAVTDSEVGLATTVGPPIAWYDSTNGEIGDICAYKLNGTITGAGGTSYTVQGEWSNKNQTCQVTDNGSNPTDGGTGGTDGGVDTTPPTTSITSPPDGTTVSGTVTIRAIAQDDVAVARVDFYVDGAIVGSAAQSPYAASWNTTTAAAGAHSLQSVATDTSGNTGTSTTVTVTVNNQVVPPTELVANGGFETKLTGWKLGGVKVPIDSTMHKHSGSYALRCGATNYAGHAEPNGDSNAQQTVTIPATANSATLSLWYYTQSSDTSGQDHQEGYVRDASGNVLATLFSAVDGNARAWQQVTLDLSAFAGQSVTLYFNVHDNGGLNPTTMWVDDVSLQYQ